MRTQRATWYEIWDSKGYSKLADPKDKFDNQREAKKAIKASDEKQKELGYTPQEWMLMIVDMICTTDENGVVISKTITEARA